MPHINPHAPDYDGGKAPRLGGDCADVAGMGERLNAIAAVGAVEPTQPLTMLTNASSLDGILVITAHWRPA